MFTLSRLLSDWLQKVCQVLRASPGDNLAFFRQADESPSGRLHQAVAAAPHPVARGPQLLKRTGRGLLTRARQRIAWSSFGSTIRPRFPASRSHRRLDSALLH